MKAAQVIAEYKNGRRDFRGGSLRGCNFGRLAKKVGKGEWQGVGLSGADFSGCDIRGTRFDYANLTGAKFEQAKAGLQRHWAVILLLAVLILVIFSSVFTGFAAYLVSLIFNEGNLANQVSGWVSLITLLIFAGLTWRKNILAVAFAGAGAIALTAFFCWMGWLTLKREDRDPWLRRIAIAFAAIVGTSFYRANLTRTDFTGARLKSTNFNQAKLDKTIFHNAVKLELARPGKTLLANWRVREFLINPSTGGGQNFRKADLRGANLDNANLRNADLTLADLSQASFVNANLRGTNFTEANAVQSDFRQATLTGACVENWNIDHTTILDNVDCQYVYLWSFD